MSNLPHPLHVLIQSYHAETQGFRKVHRLIDAFEWAIKWHTTVVMSDLLTNQQEYSDEIKVLLSAGLYTPSLGVWVFFLRELLDKNHL